MFEASQIFEFIFISLVVSLTTVICMFDRFLAILQQSGYKGRNMLKWYYSADNMALSRGWLLAFMLVLLYGVLCLCFSFVGATYAAWIALVPYVPFLIWYKVAELKKALKVEIVYTKRLVRLQIISFLVVFLVTYAIAMLANVFVFLISSDLFVLMRYLPLCLTPLLYPLLVALTNAIVKPFENAHNKKFIQSASEKLTSFEGVTVAVAGSYGKTSTKNFLKTILSEKYSVLATPYSYNTPIGIAKCVNDSDLSSYQVLICEMGARYVGDIDELAKMMRIDHALITGICQQHLETFGSIENIIREKGKVIAYAEKGVIVSSSLKDTYSDAEAENVLKGAVVEDGGIKMTMTICGEDVVAFAPVTGLHNAENIALAVALAEKLGLSKDEILNGISKLKNTEHRLSKQVVNGITIYDDTYNSNIVGAKSAIETLKADGGKKIVVTQGLVELGVLEVEKNVELGSQLVGLDRIILVGDSLVANVKDGYKDAGGDMNKISIVPDMQKAAEIYKKELTEGDSILFLNDLPDIYL